jgi:RNA polymerase sigma factor (sigma-70 family)
MDEYSLETIREYVDQLVKESWDDTYKYALEKTKGCREDAKDLTQEVFLQTYLYLKDHPEEQIRNPEKWLRKLVLNRYLNSTRSKVRQSSDSLEQRQELYSIDDNMQPVELPARSDDEPERVVECDESEKEMVEQLKKTLAPSHLNIDVIVHYFIEGRNVQEIARVLNIPLATVRQHIQIGKKELVANWWRAGEQEAQIK